MSGEAVSEDDAAGGAEREDELNADTELADPGGRHPRRAARAYRLLEEVPEFAAGDPANGNMLIQGDNLDALKALLPFYAGQVKCIFIDRRTTRGPRSSITTTTLRIRNGCR